MLERLTTRSGHITFRFNGVTLSSTVDPLQEALNWVTQHEQQIKSAPHLIVLGIGSGHHIVQLKKAYPQKKIFVIEAHKELAAAVLREQAMDFAEVEVLQEKDVMALSKSSRLQSVMTKLYRILEHRPSMAANPEFYKEISEVLLGRDIYNFNFHLQLRPELHSTFQKEKLVHDVQDKIQIKKLDKALHWDGDNSRPYMLIKALRELVG